MCLSVFDHFVKLALKVLMPRTSRVSRVSRISSLRVRQGSILGPTFFLLYINELPDDVCNIAIYADDTTPYCKCVQASDLCQ